MSNIANNYNEVQKQYEIYSQRIQEHQYNAKKRPS